MTRMQLPVPARLRLRGEDALTCSTCVADRPAGVRLFVESKALFNTSSGLLGATLDMDDDLRISIVPREGRPD